VVVGINHLLSPSLEQIGQDLELCEVVTYKLLEEMAEQYVQKWVKYQKTPSKVFSIKLTPYKYHALKYLTMVIDWTDFDDYTGAVLASMDVT